MAPPSVTRVVAKLEADGFLTRQADPDDRRVTRVVGHAEGPEPPRRVAPPEDRVAHDAPRRHGPRKSAARLADALDVLDALTTEPR